MRVKIRKRADVPGQIRCKATALPGGMVGRIYKVVSDNYDGSISVKKTDGCTVQIYEGEYDIVPDSPLLTIYEE